LLEREHEIARLARAGTLGGAGVGEALQERARAFPDRLVEAAGVGILAEAPGEGDEQLERLGLRGLARAARAPRGGRLGEPLDQDPVLFRVDQRCECFIVLHAAPRALRALRAAGP